MTEPTRDFKNAVAPEPLTRLLSGSFDHTAVDRIIASLGAIEAKLDLIVKLTAPKGHILLPTLVEIKEIVHG